MIAPSPATAQYRPDIDGLRALAVSIVVAYHAFPLRLKGGFVGVDVFFVISGYLISGIILSAIASGDFSFRDFYGRRVRRIFPALIVVLAAVVAAGWLLMFADDYLQLGRHVAGGAAFVSNFMLWREAGYFDAAADTKPLLHLWSLSIEEQFYLVWPLLLFASARWVSGPLAVTAVLGIASFAAAIVAVQLDRTAAFYAPWARFWELALGGSLAAVAFHPRWSQYVEDIPSRRLLANVLAVAGVVMIVTGVMLIREHSAFPGYWALLPAGGTWLLLLFGSRAWLGQRVLSFRPLVWVGLISYPLYLWHWPLLSFARVTRAETASTPVRLALVAASVILAWATFWLIERPIRFGSLTKAVRGLALAMVMMCAGGVTIVLTGGFSGRDLNLSEEAQVIGYYERLRANGLSAVYRSECDFMDWKTGGVRPSLDPSCTTAGRAGTVLLWGDSFAQALSLGLRENLPPGTSLAQVTTSGCPPQIDRFDTVFGGGRCARSDPFALETIERLAPLLVILAQRASHDTTDWRAVVARLRELGVQRVWIVGPAPEWSPTLPAVYARNFLEARPMYVSTGLETARFEIDRRTAGVVRNLPDTTYVSLIEQLCREGACLARVPGERDFDLMSADFGHFTPKGSSYLGRTMWKAYLERTIH